jgi:hypothetical protein
MEDPGLNYLAKELKKAEQGLLESLGDGVAQDYPKYREMCGHIRGLLYAQDLISDLAKKLEKFEDE